MEWRQEHEGKTGAVCPRKSIPLMWLQPARGLVGKGSVQDPECQEENSEQISHSDKAPVKYVEDSNGLQFS